MTEYLRNEITGMRTIPAAIRGTCGTLSEVVEAHEIPELFEDHKCNHGMRSDPQPLAIEAFINGHRSLENAHSQL